jgi:hypothetical protein
VGATTVCRGLAYGRDGERLILGDPLEVWVPLRYAPPRAPQTSPPASINAVWSCRGSVPWSGVGISSAAPGLWPPPRPHCRSVSRGALGLSTAFISRAGSLGAHLGAVPAARSMRATGHAWRYASLAGSASAPATTASITGSVPCGSKRGCRWPPDAAILSARAAHVPARRRMVAGPGRSCSWSLATVSGWRRWPWWPRVSTAC